MKNILEIMKYYPLKRNASEPETASDESNTTEKATPFELTDREQIIIHKLIHRIGFWLNVGDTIFAICKLILICGVAALAVYLAFAFFGVFLT